MTTNGFTSVAKWGNSPAIRIPKQAMRSAGLSEGDQVVIEVKAPGVLILRAAKQELTLEDLVSQITPSNRHDEMDWGRPRGSEVW